MKGSKIWTKQIMCVICSQDNRHKRKDREENEDTHCKPSRSSIEVHASCGGTLETVEEFQNFGQYGGGSGRIR